MPRLKKIIWFVLKIRKHVIILLYKKEKFSNDYKNTGSPESRQGNLIGCVLRIQNREVSNKIQYEWRLYVIYHELSRLLMTRSIVGREFQ